MRKYFIKKDFIGIPVDIVSAEYEGSVKISGNYEAPKRLLKFKSFDNLEEMLNYRPCSCHKKECEINTDFWKLVESKVKQQTI